VCIVLMILSEEHTVSDMMAGPPPPLKGTHISLSHILEWMVLCGPVTPMAVQAARTSVILISHYGRAQNRADGGSTPPRALRRGLAHGRLKVLYRATSGRRPGG
jgi:hypothetical protein